MKGRGEPPTSPAFPVGGGKQEALPCAPTALMAKVVGAGGLMGGWVQLLLGPVSQASLGWSQSPLEAARGHSSQMFLEEGGLEEGTRAASVPGRPWHKAGRTHPQGRLQWASLVPKCASSTGQSHPDTCCVLRLGPSGGPRAVRQPLTCFQGAQVSQEGLLGRCTVHESHSPPPSP